MTGVLVALCILTVLGALAGFAWWRFGRRQPPPNPQPRPQTPSQTQTPSRRSTPTGPLSAALHRDATAGRHEQVLRRLDGELPEWPASSTLIEATRDLFALQTELAAARTAGVPTTITSRVDEEIEESADILWRRADRLAAAGATAASPRLTEEMARQDEQLQRLRASIRDARAGLSELALSGDEPPDHLRRTTARLQALADTARDLHQFDQDRLP